MRLDAHFDMLPSRAFQKRGFGRAPATLEGGGKGGGGSAPSPDPNIGFAQLKLAEISDSYLKSWKEEVWPAMKAEAEKQSMRADEQFAMDRAAQEKQTALADEAMNRYRTYGYGIQDKLFTEAEQAGGAADTERQAALAIGDVKNAFGVQAEGNKRQMQAYGIDPTSGRYQGQVKANDVMEAATTAAAANKARTAAQQLGWAKRMDAAALAQGQFGNQASSTGLALTAGGQALGAGQTSMGNYAMMGNSMNQANMGAMSGWNQVGQLGVQKYNADISAYNAQQQASAAGSAGLGSLVGAGIGAVGSYYTGGAAASMKYSDIRMKENIKVEGKTPTGVNIYSFEYKPEFKKVAGYGRYIGVMAHEVPDAAVKHESGYMMVDYSKVQ